VAVEMDFGMKKVILMYFKAFEPVFGQSISDGFVIAL
jgi:hypothetical protein